MNVKSLLRPTWLPTLTGWLAVSALLAPSGVRAEIHGGIEIGSKGVKATVLEVNGEGEKTVFKVKLADSTNTALVAGIAKEGRFAPAALMETVQAVKKYQDRFRGEFRVDPEHIYVVGSSGLFASLSGKAEPIKKNQQILADAVKKGTGLAMTFIDVQREAELSILGTLPKNRRETGVLIDIGGGNTKGGYRIARGKYATFGVPLGTLTFSALAKKKNVKDGKSLIKLGDETLPPLMKKELSALPDLAKRESVYLSGGVVWAAATFAHPGDAQTFTHLTLKEVEQFEAKLLASPGAYPEVDLSAVSDKQVRQRALSEVARVKKVYTPEQALAGTQILKSVLRQLGGEKHYYFARHGYLGWILAYVAESAVRAKSS
jgi:exopolyphosphatase/pppGpp-phosphohydrolase